MKFQPVKLTPALIAVTVILFTCLIRLGQLELLDRVERITYDFRVRTAQAFPHPAATNLGAVLITEASIKSLSNGLLGRSYGLYWPRHVHGRMLRELSAQGAAAVGFDVLFQERRPDHAPVPVSTRQWAELDEFLTTLHPDQPVERFEQNGEEFILVESDDYFAWQLRRAGIAVLAAERLAAPHPLFATNAHALGDISAEPDADGVLRRVRAFHTYTNWHFLFRQVEADPGYGVDLSRARVVPGKIILPRAELDAVEVPVDADNRFEVADFVGEELPPGLAAQATAFTVDRVWHLGIVLAARQLGLDIPHTHVDLARGVIVFPTGSGTSLTLPVDQDGFFFINWELPITDRRLLIEPIEKLLVQDQARHSGRPVEAAADWRDRLVLVGSMTAGNDLTDRGTTPLGKNSLLVSKHWNVANSLLTGRFVTWTSPATDCLLIALLGALAAVMTWQWRAYSGAVGMLLLATVYVAVAVWAYVAHRYWLPIVLPIGGAVLMQHLMLVTYRAVFEERERRRVRSVFARIVSPNVVNELLAAKSLALGGARREVTVLFADVRGFTELTDTMQEQADEFVRKNHWSGAAAEACYDRMARETLHTVNEYLARVADMVKHHNGTLDKYIGDCVMAFWGAPTPHPQHARDCVRAAIDAQRAINELNQQRERLSRERETENRALESAGLPPKPRLASLTLGTGINTGSVTVGLMGSDAHILNYTVFGREVNLASRLETVSGRGRIVISEATYQALLRDDPVLAATCIALPPVTVKGIRNEVNIYEVPWQQPEPPAPTAADEDPGATDIRLK